MSHTVMSHKLRYKVYVVDPYLVVILKLKIRNLVSSLLTKKLSKQFKAFVGRLFFDGLRDSLRLKKKEFRFYLKDSITKPNGNFLRRALCVISFLDALQEFILFL